MALAENSAKLVPFPSHVAPSGYGRPSSIFIEVSGIRQNVERNGSTNHCLALMRVRWIVSGLASQLISARSIGNAAWQQRFPMLAGMTVIARTGPGRLSLPFHPRRPREHRIGCVKIERGPPPSWRSARSGRAKSSSLPRCSGGSRPSRPACRSGRSAGSRYSRG